MSKGASTLHLKIRQELVGSRLTSCCACSSRSLGHVFRTEKEELQFLDVGLTELLTEMRPGQVWILGTSSPTSEQQAGSECLADIQQRTGTYVSGQCGCQLGRGQAAGQYAASLTG